MCVCVFFIFFESFVVFFFLFFYAFVGFPILRYLIIAQGRSWWSWYWLQHFVFFLQYERVAGKEDKRGNRDQIGESFPSPPSTRHKKQMKTKCAHKHIHTENCESSSLGPFHKSRVQKTHEALPFNRLGER